MNLTLGLDYSQNPLFINILVTYSSLDSVNAVVRKLAESCHARHAVKRVILSWPAGGKEGIGKMKGDQITFDPAASVWRESENSYNFLWVEGYDRGNTQYVPRRVKWLCTSVGSSEISVGSISYLIQVSIRFDHLMNGWKSFVLEAMKVIEQHAEHRCGVIDICRAGVCDFGYAFTHESRETTFDRQTAMQMWVLRQHAGDDHVPWIGAGVILSKSAVERLARKGGLASVDWGTNSHWIPEVVDLERGGQVVFIMPRLAEKVNMEHGTHNIDWRTPAITAAKLRTLLASVDLTR
ncbi:MAG: hypothetical protein KF768_10540 [Phycisphaeraceae bacterium]|nr:hypothetical protein [Phycisphaeraceae bacterium]